MIKFSEKEFANISKDIFKVDSPTGFTFMAIKVIKKYLDEFGYRYKELNNGSIEVSISGKDTSKVVATSAHLDTLGLMVRSIKANGSLAVTPLGSPCEGSLDGEYCNIYTRDGKCYSGTIVASNESVHVYDDAHTKVRNYDNLEVRIDEEIKSKEDVIKLGINNGDLVCYDPKFEITKNGFLKSRFIDDKASVVLLLMLLKYIKENNVSLKYNTKVYFVVYEEVGFGAASVDKSISEFVTVDMGCVGADLAGNEYAVSICAKDASGPYDYELTTKLINMAKNNNINYTVDIFPHYSSDVSAARRAGVDCKGALIGTGVAASHGMERTHLKGCENTLKLIYLYLIG